MLEELRHDHEDQARRWAHQEKRWEEFQQELRADREDQARRWADQEKRWEAADKRWDEWRQEWQRERAEIHQMIESMQKLANRHERPLGAIGARWGLRSERSFRHALKGILEDSFDVEVQHVVEYDEAGDVFGRPEQVDLDIIIKDGLLIIGEIKSSMSKADMHIFQRKAAFYQKKHHKQATRLLVISPMVEPAAQALADELAIRVYSYADAVDPEIFSPPESDA